MLILTRRINEVIKINGEEVRIQVLGLTERSVKLGIVAPASMPVHREEIQQQMGTPRSLALKPHQPKHP